MTACELYDSLSTMCTVGPELTVLVLKKLSFSKVDALGRLVGSR